MDVQPSWLAPPCRVPASLVFYYFSLAMSIALAKLKKREETSKLKSYGLKRGNIGMV